jgi:uncharacterized membrane protein
MSEEQLLHKSLQKSHFRRYFLTGILVTAPVGLTLWMAWEFITWVDQLITPYIAAWMNPNLLLPFDLPGLGLLIVILGLVLVGAVMNGFLGKWFTALIEVIVSRLPVIKTVYSVIKQVLQTALTDQSTAFKEPVFVEFPRKEAWVLGFATARNRTLIDQALSQKNMVGVFVPTTPNLTSGYLIFVPETDIKPANLTSEQALKLIISGGLVE